MPGRKARTARRIRGASLQGTNTAANAARAQAAANRAQRARGEAAKARGPARRASSRPQGSGPTGNDRPPTRQQNTGQQKGTLGTPRRTNDPAPGSRTRPNPPTGQSKSYRRVRAGTARRRK